MPSAAETSWRPRLVSLAAVTASFWVGQNLYRSTPPPAKLSAARKYRESLATANPKLVVNEANERTCRPVSGGHVSRLLADGPGVRLPLLRSTRLSVVVGGLDPMMIMTALRSGIGAAMYYPNSRDLTAGDGQFGVDA